MTDGEHLDRGDIWSNKTGWQTRDEAARRMAKDMLPMYRMWWDRYAKRDISDDGLIDLIVGLGLSPLDAVLGE